jgi:hypothetical protein
MLLEKLHFYIALLAGIITTAVNFYIGASLADSITRLIIALCLFYVLGYIALRYVRKKILKPAGENADDAPPDGGEEDEISAEPTLMDDELHAPPFMNDYNSPHVPEDGFIPPIDDEAGSRELHNG